MKRRAFTLVELLVYLGMTSIALVVFMNFMVGIFANARRADAAQQMSENGRLIMAKITQASRFASNLTVTAHQVDLTSPTGTTTTYALVTGKIQENGINISNDEVTVTDFAPVKVGNALQLTLTIASTAPIGSQPNPQTLVTTLTPRQTIYQ